MAFRFRRRNGRTTHEQLLGGDARAARRVLSDTHELRLQAGRDFDLQALVDELFVLAPTAEVQALKERGIDAVTFYEEEIAPNWDDLSRGQRSVKVGAFARFANALQGADDDPGGLRPVVRTKLLVLAWANDAAYDEDYLDRIEKAPQRFGNFELAS
jgi:hypothetical protein